MGKKTVLIAGQNTLRKKVSRTTESATGVWPAIDNFRTILVRNGLKRLSGMIMYIGGKQSINFRQSIRGAKIGYGNGSRLRQSRNNPVFLNQLSLSPT